MTECEEFLSKTEAYIDGELSDEEKKRISLHLEKCPDCHSELEFAKAVRSAVKAYGTPPVPENFLDGVNKAIDAQNKKKRIDFGRMLGRRCVSAVAACLVIAAVLSLNEKEELVENVKFHEMNDTISAADDMMISLPVEVEPTEKETTEPLKEKQGAVSEQNKEKQKKAEPKKSEEPKISVHKTEETVIETVTHEAENGAETAEEQPMVQSVLSDETESVSLVRAAGGGGAAASGSADAVNSEAHNAEKTVDVTYTLFSEETEKIKAAADKFGIDVGNGYKMTDEAYSMLLSYIEKEHIECVAPKINGDDEFILVISQKTN